MTRIGLLSDTHGFIDEKILTFFKDVDEIWHAGDIGNIETSETLMQFKPLKAVYGNIDDFNVRKTYPKILDFMCEEARIIITHIGGYPGNYAPEMKAYLSINKPTIFIAGHSHILKVIYDKKLDFLHLNPGAAGNSGFHKVKTAMRFAIDKDQIKNLEIWEIARN
jgi:uncharacterized protein